MNMEKLTQKALEAVRSAQSLAEENGNQQLTQVHLLQALLSAEDGLIPKLLSRMGADVSALLLQTKQKTDALPKVSGTGQIIFRPSFQRRLTLRKNRCL